MAEVQMRKDALFIGIGNPDRGDDGVGREVIHRLRERGWPETKLSEVSGEATELMDTWVGRDRVVLIDAMHSGRQPGTVLHFDATDNPVPAILRSCSTHGFGVAAAVELARAIDALPDLVEIIAIEIGDAEEPGLSPAAATAVDQVVRMIEGDGVIAASGG
jgi:hydrogenase maturation protease